MSINTGFNILRLFVSVARVCVKAALHNQKVEKSRRSSSCQWYPKDRPSTQNLCTDNCFLTGQSDTDVLCPPQELLCCCPRGHIECWRPPGSARPATVVRLKENGRKIRTCSRRLYVCYTGSSSVSLLSTLPLRTSTMGPLKSLCTIVSGLDSSRISGCGVINLTREKINIHLKWQRMEGSFYQRVK